jgi:DNA-binding helix-hairpin-helix protein with protein kinase domain
MVLLNERGDVVRLGPRLTTPGGEGTIYEVALDSSLLAKLYHSPAHAQQVAKLQHLCREGNQELLTIAALPRCLLFASDERRTVRGFLMPRIQGKEIHQLYGPRDRQMEFPSAAWDFLIHAARNCAAAFDTLHENGILMADVNEKNLLVTSNGLVRLIDCDSYQVRNGNGHFLCDVGSPLWTAPELQTRVHQHGYPGLERTRNHDRFGLAVLVFELLFMGRHPFAGVPEGHHHFEIHEAIQRYLFAFSPQAWQHGIKPPPHTLPLGALPEKLVRLFDRAFLPGSERPNTRPTGREWAHELDALHAALKTCSYDPSHKYWNGLPRCPWCQIAADGGPNFFISVAIHLGTPGAVADVSVFWATIQRVTAGELMRKSVGPIQLPAVAARPMPLARPTAPRLSKPQAPSPFVPPPSPVVAPPLFPTPPELAPPAPIPGLLLGRYERDDRAIGFGVIFCGLACLASIGLELLSGAFIAGAGAIVFLLLKSDRATGERRQRLEAERQLRKEERGRANEYYVQQLVEHNATVKRMKEEYATAVAHAEVAHAHEQSRLDADYRSRMSTYSAQLSLFENAWAKFEEEKRRWDSEGNARTRSVEQTHREMNDTLERLRSTLNEYQSKVRAFTVNLESAYQRFQKASADEASDMKSLEAKKRDAQLRQFLDSKLIRNHRIRGIGQVKAATLVAYGYESALDITPTMNVTGVGPVLLRALLAWRGQCEAAFRYNPNTPLPQAEVQAVKLKYAQARQAALVELRGGAGTLSAWETETRKAVNSLESKIPQLARAHAQAVADQRECS